MPFNIGFCEQSISSTDYIVTYDRTPSYTESTATLRCIEGYVAVEPGSAVCGSDGQWIIEYPECEGTWSSLLQTNCYLIIVLCRLTTYYLAIKLS